MANVSAPLRYNLQTKTRRPHLGADAVQDLNPTKTQRQFIKNAYADIISLLKVYDSCLCCNSRFCLWDHVGRHNCQTHPGRFDGANGIWLCCQAQYADPHLPTYENKHIIGCRAADHVMLHMDPVLGFDEEDVLCLPLPVFLLLPHRDKRRVSEVRYQPTGLSTRGILGHWSDYQVFLSRVARSVNA